MKIKIIVPAICIQLYKQAHAGDVVDLPFHQAEHLIRLNQAVAEPEKAEGLILKAETQNAPPPKPAL
jgi:hypothetical protein